MSGATAVYLRSACVALASLFLCPVAFALPGDRTLAQLYHSRWTVQDGAPSGIDSIAQTSDGYIWLAAGGRLFRFDGLEFEHIDRVGNTPLPAEKIYGLWARPEGGLWVSYQYGGATFIGDGFVDNYFTAEGLPPNTLKIFAQDGMGGMWAGTTLGLLRLEAGRWTFAGDAWGLPQKLIEDATLDRDGTLWILNTEGLFYLCRGSQRFASGLRVQVKERRAHLTSSPDGVAWFALAGFGLTDLQTPSPGKQVQPRWRTRGFESEDDFPYSLIDRHANVWLHASGNVTRIPLDRGDESDRNGANAHEASEFVRLAGDLSNDMLEDHEGNIWVISSGGVDKFRSAAFAKLPLSQGVHAPAIVAQDDGSVWIGTSRASLHRFAGGVEREVLRAPTRLIEALHQDSRGRLWVGGPEASIWHQQAGRWIEWQPDDAKNAGGIQAIASAPDGSLWVSIVRAGVYRVVDNHWTLRGGLADLPREPATTVAFDSSGRLWLGYVGSRAAVVDRGKVTLFDASDGLSTGAVQVTTARGRNVWVGGERGVNWFDGQRFHSIAGEHQRAFANVNGIVENAQGDLWLNTSEGAVLIRAAEVRRFIANPSRVVQFRLFDYLDGMPGAATRIRPLPTAAEGPDGRIWFSGTNGVVSLTSGWDTANTIAPNVRIKSAVVDGNRVDVAAAQRSPLRLPANPRVLQIAYTALSFAVPERVRFKYRLEGTDMGWQDVGVRREVQFTGLTPGNYRFHVIASNDAGVWNETGAALDFFVPPTFLQSRAFILLCIATASAGLWLLFLLRMRQLKSQLQSRSDERLMERERIARELHDTFLQGVHGLMLRFQSATERIPEGEPARRLMEDALDRADRVLAEGRDKVAELRASNWNLPESLALVGSELSRDHAILFASEVDGAQRELNPLVQEEAYRLGCEALANAFRHSRATHINVTVEFGRRCFGIRVVDDGTGFDLSNRKPGRWGLKGMRERAERVRGRLAISSQPGTGTTVELQVPAKLAYKRAERTRWRWLTRFRRPHGESK